MKKIRVKNKVMKTYIKTLSAGYTTSQPIDIDSDTINIMDGLYINKHPRDVELHERGIIFCGLFTLNTFDGRTVAIIFFDSYFIKLPNKVKKFLVYHEIGHYINGDHKISEIDSMSNILKRCVGILPKNELYADKYAAAVVGVDNSIETLRYILLATDVSLISKIELIRRIIAVRK